MKRVIISAVVALLSSAAFGSSFATGPADYSYIHSHFSSISIAGKPARLMFEHLATPNQPDLRHNLAGSKLSLDGRVWCVEFASAAEALKNGSASAILKKYGAYHCELNFDSSSGRIYRTWSN